jgi:hypothetical protein
MILRLYLVEAAGDYGACYTPKSCSEFGGRTIATGRRPTASTMRAQGWKPSAAEIAAIATHVRNDGAMSRGP